MSHTATSLPAPARLSTSDRLVQDVLDGLLSGRYVAGQRLVEPDLMAQYNVGRSTVREALKRLEAQGIVEIQLNRGARIRRLDRADALHYLELAEAIYGLTARLAAANIDRDGHRARLEDMVVRLVQAAQNLDSQPFLRARVEFQDTLVTLSENPHVAHLFKGLQIHILRHQMITVPETIVRGFRATATAVLAGDPDRAELAARQQVRKLMAQLTAKAD